MIKHSELAFAFAHVLTLHLERVSSIFYRMHNCGRLSRP